MTTDLVPLVAGRSKITPGWITSIEPTKWLNEVGWVCDGAARLPDQPGAAPHLKIALFQRDGHWLAIATRAGSCFRFDLLSFIALWNECAGHGLREASPDISIELFADVATPYVLRHPSVIPMEVGFDHQTDRFRRSMIYSIFDVSEDPD